MRPGGIDAHALRSFVVGICSMAFTCAPAQSRVVESSDGVPISFDVYGDGSPSLVFVHGWSNNRNYWAPHVSYFAASHRVVTIDLAGHGESGRDRSEWTIERFGEDVAAVVNELNLKDTVLVGFSMGGPSVLEAARHIPDGVIGIVLVDILQDIDSEFSQTYVDDTEDEWRRLLDDPDYLKTSGAFSPNAPDELVRRYIDSHRGGYPEYWWEAFRDFFRWSNERTKPVLSELDLPIAAINSDQAPTNIDAFRAYAPTFSVRLVPGVGHVGTIWEKPILFQQRLDETVAGFLQ